MIFIYKKLFFKSWKDLKKNPNLILPDIFLAIINGILIFAFLMFLVSIFAQVPLFGEFLQSIPSPGEASSHDFTGYGELFKQVNIPYFIGGVLFFILAALVVTLLFKTVKLGMIRDVVLNKGASIKKFKTYVKENFWNVILMHLVLVPVYFLIFILFILAFLVLGFIVLLLSKLSVVLSQIVLAIATICLILLVVMYHVYFFCYSFAALLLDKKTPRVALSEIWSICKTKRKFAMKSVSIILITVFIGAIVVEAIGFIPYLDVLGLLLYLVFILWAYLFAFNTYKLRSKLN